jgi:hypothetical protein
MSTVKNKKPRIFVLGYFEIDLTFRLCQSSPPPSDHTPGRFLVCDAMFESVESMSLLCCYTDIFISFFVNVNGPK